MKRSLLVVMMALAIAGAACKTNETRVAYSHDAWRVVPVVKGGESIHVVNRRIKWIDNPCKPEGNNPEPDPYANPCEIRSGIPTGTVFEYECPDDPCDPEIAVDDPPVIIGPKPAMAADMEPDVHIKIRCDSSGNVSVAPMNPNARRGELVAWGKYGTEVSPDWQVKIESDALCEEGMGPFGTGAKCRIKADAPAATYKYTVLNACQGGPRDDSITVP